MRFILSIIILSTSFVFSQKSCDNAKVIALDSLKFQSSQSEIIFFRVRKDSTIDNFRFNGGFEKIEINPSECGFSTSVQLDSLGLIIPTEEMINSGVCYCQSCIERYSKVKLDKEVYLKITNPDHIKIEQFVSDDHVVLKWYEKELKSGDKIRLDKILFIGGQAKFRSVSFRDLNRLVKVLQNNPDVHVEIGGHVNSPGRRNTKKSQGLSEARSKAVVDYLVKKGINESRLSHVGYGNTQMIYPKTKNEYEMQFNRRVEILVK